MRRDILIGTTVGVAIGVITYLFSRRRSNDTVEIDPSVYTKQTIHKIPNPKYKHPDRPVIDSIFNQDPVAVYQPPYDIAGFGLDSARNNDTIDADSYLNMPLESDGITYQTRHKYTNLEEIPETVEKRYKYIRFTILSVRDSEQSSVAIGGIKFLKKGFNISGISLWDPHTGKKAAYVGDEWSDSDQWTAVFVFSEPISFTEYQIRTSMKMPEMDPAEWKIEGSHNASYWSEIDRRTSDLPYDRGVVTRFTPAKY